MGGVRNGGGEGCRKSRSAEEEEVHGTRTDDISALKLETARPHTTAAEGWEVEVGSGKPNEGGAEVVLSSQSLSV